MVVKLACTQHQRFEATLVGGLLHQGISECMRWSNITAPVNKDRHFIP